MKPPEKMTKLLAAIPSYGLRPVRWIETFHLLPRYASTPTSYGLRPVRWIETPAPVASADTAPSFLRPSAGEMD